MAKPKQVVKEGRNEKSAPTAEPAPAPGPRPAPRLLERYRREVVPALMARFGYRNVWQVPRLEKIMVNVGLGEALQDAKALDNAARDIAILTGQRPVITRAKKSIAGFKLREGNPIGIKATLRGERMYAFLDRLVNLALPRVRDFRGVSSDAFDGRGNYSLGLSEQLIWPEIEYDSIDKVRGLELTIVTTARSDDEARELLRLLGMPFGRS
ncbi:MAG: 50S ribosomal protein L5 [Chloroflexi bacterium]|nr:50S ribosomal protein L5 [Chloroflexota bacterium]